MTLAANGTLRARPGFGTAGSYPITITATDANATATQAFTLTVRAAGPVFTSAASTSFSENAAGTFAVTATGDTPITFTESGSLPTGVTLAANGTLSGTPGPRHGRDLPDHHHGHRRQAATATQTFTLTVRVAPVFTSAASHLHRAQPGPSR